MTRQGRTLDLFEKDSRGRSACAGACATYWPPLTVRRTPTTGAAAERSLLGTIRRSNGARQVTYHGPHLDGFGDPVAVMVLDAGPAYVETAIVGGDIVKRQGNLVGVRDHARFKR